MDVQSHSLFPAAPARFSAPSVAVNSSVSAIDASRLSAQCLKVLMYLRNHGQITPAIARGMGINRLAARIGDLRKAGYAIETTGVKDREAVYAITPAGVAAIGQSTPERSEA